MAKGDFFAELNIVQVWNLFKSAERVQVKTENTMVTDPRRQEQSIRLDSAGHCQTPGWMEISPRKKSRDHNQ